MFVTVNSDKQTAHSMHSLCGFSILTVRFLFGLSDIAEVVDRKMPDHFTQVDRDSFLKIAERATQEAVNLYTIASLGMQSFVCARDAIEVSK